MTGSAPAPTAVNVKPPQAVNTGLYNQFLSQFGGAGGAGAAGINALSSIAKGTNVQPLYAAIKAAAQQNTQQGLQGIMSNMGASGLASSSTTAQALTNYQLQSDANLNQQLQQLLFQSTAMQLQAGTTLEETFGNAALQFAPTQEVVGGGAAGPSPFSQVAGAVSGGGGAAAAILAAIALCWISRAIYGETSWEAQVIRWHLWTNVRHRWWGRPLVWLYQTFGRWVAEAGYSWRFKRLTDLVLKEAVNGWTE